MGDPFESRSDENAFTTRQAVLLALVPPLLIMMGMALIRLLLEQLFGPISWNSPFMIAELLIVVPVVQIARRRNLPLGEIFRLRSVPSSILFWSLLLALAVGVIGDQLDRIVQLFFPQPAELAKALELLFLTKNIPDFLLMLLIASAGAGICEEMLYRGFLQGVLESRSSKWVAIVASTVFFAIIHLNPWMLFQILALGTALGYLAWRTQSIYPSIIVHSLNNLIAILYIRWHTPAFDSVYLKNDLVAPGIVLAAIAVAILSVKRIEALAPEPYHQ